MAKFLRRRLTIGTLVILVLSLCAAMQAASVSASTPILSSTETLGAGTQSMRVASLKVQRIRVAVVLVRPPGAARLVTHAQLQSSVFGSSTSVYRQYRQMSYGHARLRGKVFGAWRVSNTVANCTPCLTNAVNRIARRRGVKLSNFNKVVIVVDNGSSNGMAILGGRWAWVWTCECGGSVEGRANLLHRDIVHEVGHLLGIHHAHTRRCTDANGNPDALGTNCTNNEYGDEYDSMGNSYGANFSTSQRWFLGWMAPSQVKTISVDGSYSLTPGSALDTGVKLLRIPLRNQSTGATQRYLNIETRQRTGFDGPLLSTSAGIWPGAPTTGVLVRVVTTRTAGTWLIDSTPATNNGQQDLPLQVGSSITDAQSGVTVSLDSELNGFAQVQVNFPT